MTLTSDVAAAATPADPTIEITVSGGGDDLVEIMGCKGEDEFDHISGLWRGDLIAPNGETLRLHVFYLGTWHVAVGQVDEDVPLPEWDITFEQSDRAYSVQAVITAPVGTRLTNIGTAKKFARD